jgi:hypothetical protein
VFQLSIVTILMAAGAASASDWVVVDSNEEGVAAVKVEPTEKAGSVRNVSVLTGFAEPEYLFGKVIDLMVVRAELDCSGKRFRPKGISLQLGAKATEIDSSGAWESLTPFLAEVCDGNHANEAKASRRYATPTAVVADFRKSAVRACVRASKRASGSALRKFSEAEGRPWYDNSTAVSVAGRRFEKFGLPRELLKHELDFFSSEEGVLFAAEAGYSGDPEIIYALVDRDTCSFQPYQRSVGQQDAN